MFYALAQNFGYEIHKLGQNKQPGKSSTGSHSSRGSSSLCQRPPSTSQHVGQLKVFHKSCIWCWGTFCRGTQLLKPPKRQLIKGAKDTEDEPPKKFASTQSSPGYVCQVPASQLAPNSECGKQNKWSVQSVVNTHKFPLQSQLRRPTIASICT